MLNLNFFLALGVSILIHLGVYFYFLNTNHSNHNIVPKKPEGKIATSVQYVKLKPKPKIIKKQEPKKPKPKPIKKPKIIELPKKFLPKQIKKIKEPKKVIKKEKIDTQKLDQETKEYIELYDNFEQFPQKTKLYLIKNIKNIGIITQRYLIYPMMSVQAGQEGVNVIEFILYPNGEITVPRIVKSSNYFLLDDNTIETIQEAYKDYPRPQKPTPIRIFVKYKLIRN